MHRDSRTGSGPGVVVAVRHSLASGLTLVGILFIVLGILRAIALLDVLPAGVDAALASWWPLILVIAGVWWARAGHRITGTALTLAGTVMLLFTAVPPGFKWPALFILLGALLIWGATGGRRWLNADHASLLAQHAGTGGWKSAGRSCVAIFGEASTRLHPGLAEGGPVDCLAVFGNVQVEVPADIAVDLSETAIFGDVRSSRPPAGNVNATVKVRATAVFGDVSLTRD